LWYQPAGVATYPGPGPLPAVGATAREKLAPVLAGALTGVVTSPQAMGAARATMYIKTRCGFILPILPFEDYNQTAVPDLARRELSAVDASRVMRAAAPPELQRGWEGTLY
jgi:hypothetical protein